MARQKKNRLFDLFKKDFTITTFFKPNDIHKEPYYIILNGVVQLRIWVIGGILVIDEVTVLTKSYIKAVFDKIVNTLANQTEFTILISAMTSSNVLAQSCIQAELPTVEDDRYITIPKGYYDKIVNMVTSGTNINMTVGFYLVAVSDAPESFAIGKPNQLQRISEILRSKFPNVSISTKTDNTALEVSLRTPYGSTVFEVVLVENKIVVRDAQDSKLADIGFVQLTKLVSCIEQFTEVLPEVLFANVQSVELFRLCEARGYQHISESTPIFKSNLFGQIHCGYGTYRVEKITN